MTPPPFTPKGETREKVYRYVREQLQLGRCPTLREVQAFFGFGAVETVRSHLSKLVEEGRLKKTKGARGYVLPELERTETFAIPLLGRVPAGGLEEAVEEREGTVLVAAVRGKRGAQNWFALRVEGESMTGAGILPGDVVIVEPTPTARSGEIVVAMVGDEATVKTLRRTGRRVELHPENPRYKPIIPERPQDLRILGRVVELRRELSS